MKRNSLVVVVESLLKRSRAHLARGVAAPHFKVYICGSRNGISILDSDKTLLSLTNALNFIGNLIRTKKARFFLLNTNNIFIYEIMDEMVDFMQKNQWKIGEFLNSCSTSKKHIRSRKINMLLGFQRSAPDCVLILDASIKSSVILEADRAQIPIVSFIDSSTPFLYVNKITYPIPAMKDIKFVYLFANLISKTEQQQRKLVGSRYYFANKPESNSWIGRLTNELFFFWTLPLGVLILILYYFRILWLFVSFIQFLISQTCDFSLGVLPDLNQAPPADEGTAEPPAPPLQPLLEVIHDEIVTKLERKVRQLGPRCGVVVDASLINEGARHVIEGLEIDPNSASDLLGLQNLLKTDSRKVDLIIKQFLEGKKNG